METGDAAVDHGFIPKVLLGQQYHSYTKAIIWKILDFYAVKPDGTTGMYPKSHLIRLMGKLARKKGRTSDHYESLPTPCSKGLLALGLIEESQTTPAQSVPGSPADYRCITIQDVQRVSPPHKKDRAEAIRWLGISRVRSIERLIRKRENRAPLQTALTLPELDTILAILRVVKQSEPRAQTSRETAEDSTSATATALAPSFPSPLTQPIVALDKRAAVRRQHTIIIQSFLQSELQIGRISATSVHDVAQGLACSMERHVYRKAKSDNEYRSLLKSSLRQLMRPETARALIRSAEERITAGYQPAANGDGAECPSRAIPTPSLGDIKSTTRKMSRILTLRNSSTQHFSRLPARVVHNSQLTSLPDPSARAIAVTFTKERSTKDTPACIACFDVLILSTTPRRRITSFCAHEPLICTGCLAQSIASQLEVKIWNQVECPTCNARLSYVDVQAFATEPVFRRYDHLATLEAMSALPYFRRCLAPGCESGQVHFEGAARPIMTCVACGWKSCYVHETEWHEGRTCDEIDKQLAETQRVEGEANQAYLAENTKKCPNEHCGRPIEKNGGCAHMKCSQCRHQFCWDCLAPWNQVRRRGNDAHAETCRWHSQNIQSHPADVAAIRRIRREGAVFTPAEAPALAPGAEVPSRPPSTTPAGHRVPIPREPQVRDDYTPGVASAVAPTHVPTLVSAGPVANKAPRSMLALLAAPVRRVPRTSSTFSIPTMWQCGPE